MATVTIPNRPAGSGTRSIAQITANFDSILTFLNGQNLDPDNLDDALLQKMGVSDSSVVRRGKSIIATEEARTNTAYGLLTTPDRVQNVVMPTDGFILVAYQAMWKGVGGAPSAAIFLGANQLVGAQRNNASPQVQNAAIAASSNYNPLATSAAGLVSGDALGSDYAGDATTGQIVGVQPDGTNGARFESGGTGSSLANSVAAGPCAIFAAAGTYDVTVQFKCSAGTVTAKNRKLWVWTMAF